MNAEVLSIGSELMAGRIADTNAAFLSEQLQLLGFDVVRHTTVGDRRADIRAAIEEIAPRADLVLVTGGLGPTRDDPTRESFAAACGADLVEDPESTRRIREMFAARHAPVGPSNLSQAYFPRGGEVLRNSTGTAAGFAVRLGRCRFFCMPGVPSEMKVMFRESVEPQLRSAAGRATLVRSLHIFGLGESTVGERLFDLMAEDHNPEVATQVHDGLITLRLTATDSGEAAARRRLDEAETQVRARLGSTIFGADETATLQAAVAALLQRTGLKVAFAESCTGGELSARLTDVPGISAFLLESAVTYSNESKIRRLGVPPEVIEREGAVSAATAEAMARGMRATSGADVALGVTGIAGPDGGTAAKPVGLVYIALADAAGARVEEAHFRGTRQQIKDRAAKSGLNMLRLYLEGHTA
ncbi:MAG: competence/damage-inducible protein A [Candidatus Brocadiia bacterium]